MRPVSRAQHIFGKDIHMTFAIPTLKTVALGLGLAAAPLAAFADNQDRKSVV